MKARAALVALVAVLAVFAIPGTAAAANPCSGIPRCIPVAGPWVSVPATGEADYYLSCPGGKGVVAGTDGLASSTDIRATFDGILGAPVAFGRTTQTAVLFRAVSGHHRPGFFKPFIGCIPLPSSVRNTIATAASPLGPPLDYVARTIAVTPGFQRVVTLTCPAGDSLVDSWSTTAFTSTRLPTAGLGSAVNVQARLQARQARLLVSASETLPRGSQAVVQVGVRCAS